MNEELPEESEFDWLDEIDEDIEASVKAGLKAANPRMVEVAMQLRQQRETGQVLKDLQIEIVPYRIKDTSLRKIILEAPDYIIDEVEEALKERRRLREFGGVIEDDDES